MQKPAHVAGFFVLRIKPNVSVLAMRPVNQESLKTPWTTRERVRVVWLGGGNTDELRANRLASDDRDTDLYA